MTTGNHIADGFYNPNDSEDYEPSEAWDRTKAFKRLSRLSTNRERWSFFLKQATGVKAEIIGLFYKQVGDKIQELKKQLNII